MWMPAFDAEYEKLSPSGTRMPSIEPIMITRAGSTNDAA